jgi:hypothetical protein
MSEITTVQYCRVPEIIRDGAVSYPWSRMGCILVTMIQEKGRKKKKRNHFPNDKYDIAVLGIDDYLLKFDIYHVLSESGQGLPDL